MNAQADQALLAKSAMLELAQRIADATARDIDTILRRYKHIRFARVEPPSVYNPVLPQDYRIELEINIGGQIYHYDGFISALMIERAIIEGAKIVDEFLRRLLHQHLVAALLEKRTDEEIADLAARGHGVNVKATVSRTIAEETASALEQAIRDGRARP